MTVGVPLYTVWVSFSDLFFTTPKIIYCLEFIKDNKQYNNINVPRSAKVLDMLMIPGRVTGKVFPNCNGNDSLGLRKSMDWRLSIREAGLARSVRLEVPPLTIVLSQSPRTPSPICPQRNVAPFREASFAKRRELRSNSFEGKANSGLTTNSALSVHEEPHGQFVKSLALAYPKLPCRFCAGMSNCCKLAGIRVG